MAYTPMYEQVSGANPRQAFVPSGLYRLVGHVRDKQFVRSTTGGPLRTLEQWKAMVEAHPTPSLPRRTIVCGHCGENYEFTHDESENAMPCHNCGLAWNETSRPGVDAVLTFDPPNTMARVVKLQKARALFGQVADDEAVAVTPRRLPLPPPPFEATPMGDGLGRIVAYQMAHGLQEAMPETLRTMDASAPCGRCGGSRSFGAKNNDPLEVLVFTGFF